MSENIHWKACFDPDYLGAYAFQPGEEKTVTIKEVKNEEVFNPSKNKKENCRIAYFVEDIKPLILNQTNCKMIEKVLGTPILMDWDGHKITLRVRKVSAFGETVPAVRVSPERPMDEVVKCQDCGKPITAVPGKTVQQIVLATEAKYGKSLCIECAKKNKEDK